MAWKAIGHPAVRRQRDKWVVRVDGIDTVTGKRRPRQLGSYSSQRAARSAAASMTAAGEIGSERGTVGQLVNQWATSRIHVGNQTRLQYEWAAERITRDLGAIRLDQLDREDIARWLEELAAGGYYARRSIRIFRMVLRAALEDAVASGDIRRNPAARVGMPRHVVKPDLQREAQTWTEDEVRRFVASIDDHRWAAPIRLCVLYGLRRSELLGLRWSCVDLKRALDPHRARPRRGPRPPGMVRRQERPVAPDDRDRRVDRAIARRPPQVPGRGAAPRRFRLGRQRPRRRHQDRHAGFARQLRPDPGAADRRGPACRGSARTGCATPPPR